GNLDIGRGAFGRAQAWRGVIVKILRKRGGSAVPFGPGEAALLFAAISFGAETFRLMGSGEGFAARTHLRLAIAEDVEGRRHSRRARSRESRGLEDRFQLARPNDGIDFGDIFPD